MADRIVLGVGEHFTLTVRVTSAGGRQATARVRWWVDNTKVLQVVGPGAAPDYSGQFKAIASGEAKISVSVVSEQGETLGKSDSVEVIVHGGTDSPLAAKIVLPAAMMEK
jgi:hypothetical protein